jgi:hypothetical protein
MIRHWQFYKKLKELLEDEFRTDTGTKGDHREASQIS